MDGATLPSAMGGGVKGDLLTTYRLKRSLVESKRVCVVPYARTFEVVISVAWWSSRRRSGGYVASSSTYMDIYIPTCLHT